MSKTRAAGRESVQISLRSSAGRRVKAWKVVVGGAADMVGSAMVGGGELGGEDEGIVSGGSGGGGDDSDVVRMTERDRV